MMFANYLTACCAIICLPLRTHAFSGWSNLPLARHNTLGQSHCHHCQSQFKAKRLHQTAIDLDSRNNVNKGFQPSWRDILEIPIRIDTKQQFDNLSTAKRVAIVSRTSVLHLTFLSCFGPFIIRGAIRSALPAHLQHLVTLTPKLAILFTLQGLAFHAWHNLLNDWQDLEDDDSDAATSFRLSYGCHALQQKFMTKAQFLRLMAMVSSPGVLLTLYFFKMHTSLAPAAVYGILALFFYTIVFKPLALGELLIYFVWGPLMAGFGSIAAGATHLASRSFFVPSKLLFTSPVCILFGLTGFSVIMGKHTDKIRTSKKRTLPKVLGLPNALLACGVTLVLPYAVLCITLIRERVLKQLTRTTSEAMGLPSLPIGSALAFLALFRELPASLQALRRGAPQGNEPTLPFGTVIPGTLRNAHVDRAWPLWFVAFMGWHAITFAYLMVIGSGMEWGLRAIMTQFLR